jgi:hypothetical protein
LRSRSSDGPELSCRLCPSVGNQRPSLFVLIARRMEPGRSGSLSQRPLGQAPGWPFASPVCPACLVQGTAERPLPEIDGSHILYRKPSATPLSSKLATQSISEPIEYYLRLPRRRWTASFECVALAMISPALRAKPLSSTGATSALDFNERFAGPCRSSERACRFFFSPMNDSATCFIDPSARSGALVPCPLISIHAVDVPIRALLEKHYRSAFGPEDIANLAAAFEAALSKLGLVDRKDPRDDDSGEVDHRGAKSGGAIPRQEKITRGRL